MRLRVLLILLLAAPAAFALPLTGKVRLSGRPAGTNATTIVYAEALDGATPVKPGKFSIAQKNKDFIPHVLAIPVGSTVDFPNEDLIFHNVFTLSRPNPFDLGLYRSGDASKSRIFKTASTYRVFCNIHPQMAAVILVLPTSYIAEADSSGNYRLDLPAGRYRITAWSERSQPSTTEITIGPGAPSVPDLTLNESNAPEAPHKNMYGQDYPKSAYEDKKP